MRALQRKSTALCNLEIYSNYLLTVPVQRGCTKLANSMENMSHDAVLHHLVRESYEPKDLFVRSKSLLTLSGGRLSVDDSVHDKPSSNAAKFELIGKHYSGEHDKVVQGICLISLFYTDIKGRLLPVNYRIYQQGGVETKNDLFVAMFEEVLSWGLQPKTLTGVSWYASLYNLKLCRKYRIDALFAIEQDRLIFSQKGQYQRVN